MNLAFQQIPQNKVGLAMNLEGFRPLGIETKPLYDRCVAQMACGLPSSIQFPSLYAYDENAVNRWTLLEDLLCFVVYDSYGDQFFALPPMGPYEPERFERVIARLYQRFHQSGLPLVFCEVPPGLLDQFTCLEGFDVQVRHSVETSDYVFSKDAFVAGLSKRSNRYALRHLETNLEPRCEPVDPRHRPLMEELTRRYFCAHHSCDECVYGCELIVVARFMREWEALGLQGVIAQSPEGPLGYIVAYQDRDTLFAFSKRVRHGVRGLNEYLNRQLLHLFGGRFQTINYSEDMGHPGMRFYKERLGVYSLQHRFRVTVTPTNAPGKGR